MKVPWWRELSTREVIIGIIILILVLAVASYIAMFASLVLWGSTNHVPAKYTYTVIIGDLNSCTTDGNIEVLVPIPYVNGQQAYTDEELNRTFGSWRSAAKMTVQGKMISLTCPDKTLSSPDIRYEKTSGGLPQISSARDLCFSIFSKAENQSFDSLNQDLATYEETSGHPSAYKSFINYSDSDGWMLGNTTVIINGRILKPEPRKAITVDLSFVALAPVPDGAQPPAYVVCSSAAMDQTNNATYAPVVLSYRLFGSSKL